jgi:ribosome-associated protein
MIPIDASLSIPFRDIHFVYGTSSGPGGQHVNKVATKATLLFHVHHGSTLSQVQRDRLLKTLKTRINKEGVLRVSSSKHRSQRANREAAIERFCLLLREALKERKKRKKSLVSRSQKQRRLDQKKKRGERKKFRAKVEPTKH